MDAPSSHTDFNARAADAIRTGHGIVRLRDDAAHEGDYTINGSWVTMTGRRRNPQASGDILYSPKGTWAWPARRVEVVIDLEHEHEASS